MAMVRLYGGYAVHVHMLAGHGQCDIYVVEMDWFTVAAPLVDGIAESRSGRARNGVANFCNNFATVAICARPPGALGCAGGSNGPPPVAAHNGVAKESRISIARGFCHF